MFSSRKSFTLCSTSAPEWLFLFPRTTSADSLVAGNGRHYRTQEYRNCRTGSRAATAYLIKAFCVHHLSAHSIDNVSQGCSLTATLITRKSRSRTRSILRSVLFRSTASASTQYSLYFTQGIVGGETSYPPQTPTMQRRASIIMTACYSNAINSNPTSSPHMM